MQALSLPEIFFRNCFCLSLDGSIKTHDDVFYAYIACKFNLRIAQNIRSES